LETRATCLAAFRVEAYTPRSLWRAFDFMPRLVFKKGEQSPVEITGATVLGRSADQSQIAIKDNRLSRAHCKFEPRDDGQWAIVDLGSQNGTFLNGRRVRESVVRPGDVVTIGQCDILFEAVGGPTGSDLMAGVKSTRISAAQANAPAELALEEENESAGATRTVVAPAALALLKGTLKDKIFPLIKDVFIIGRKVGNDIVLDGDGKSSGQHAKITRRDATTWVIEDLKSTNGVTVNGHKVTEAVVLKNGARIEIGSQLFQFTLQGKPVETSGVTAPMSAKAVAARLSEPEEAASPMDAGDSDIGSRSEEVDKAALNVEVRGGSKSGMLFSAIEILLAIAVVGGVLFGGYLLLQDEKAGTTTSEGNPPPSEGGIIKANSSFDKIGAAGLPEGWSFDPRGGDALSMTESAHGGEHAVQLTRFTTSNGISYLLSSPVEVSAKGFKASVFALNSELSASRTGSALLALFWYKDFRDPAFAVSPLAAASNLKEWTELKGSAGAPKDAKWVKVALGISGRSGSVVFDDSSLAEDPAAPPAPVGASIDLKNGLTWSVDPNGLITLSQKSAPLLRDGLVTMHQVDGENDPLDISLVLQGPPTLEQNAESFTLRYKYFDPMAERSVELRLDFGEIAQQATLAMVFSANGADKASSQAALTFIATPAFVPSELLRIESGHVAEYKRELPDDGRRITISTMLCADTGTGNKIEGINGSSPAFSARMGQGGRKLFFQSQGGMQLGFSLGQRRDELRNLVMQASSVQAGEEQLDRLAHAIKIIQEFPFNQQELMVAAVACDSVATHYKLRHLELRDGVNVPELTRNEGLYIAAMDESINSALKLRGQSNFWSEKVLPDLRTLEALSMSEATQRAAKTAKQAIEELIQSANEFEELAKVARKSRFWLRVAIEQRESANLLASAQDFLNSGLLTQGRIKLKAIIEKYPRCANGIAAKALLVSQAETIFAESEKRAKDGLGSIAGQLKGQSRNFLSLVEQNLLSSDKVLSPDERQWLMQAAPGEDAKNWIDLEGKLAERIRLLREKVGK
jgi:pSer/pThr/pTyr-binding forkhead associated (FHA) protein